MRRLRYGLGLLLVAVSACSGSNLGPDYVGNLVISNGTSFNFCMGYCRTELVVDSTMVRFTEKGSDEDRYPTRTRSATLTHAAWRRIRALAEAGTLSSVAGVHGCPDCADGGAEWVEIRTVDDSIRATFEYRDVLDPISELQEELRALRELFQ